MDRTLRTLLGKEDAFMGGVPFIAAGDPRQIPPVIIYGNRANIVNHSIYTNSAIWSNFQKHTLRTNMRVQTQGHNNDFALWLLQVGEGTHEQPSSDITPPVPKNSIELPAAMCIDNTCLTSDDKFTAHPSNASKDALLDFVYAGMDTSTDLQYFENRIIVTPRLDAAAEINACMIQRMHGTVHTYLSADSIVYDAQRSKFPTEFLNGINDISGMPPHELNLKVGMPVILLKNMRPPKHCNGTRYTIQSVHTNYLRLYTLTGHGKGETFMLPRIVQIPGANSTSWPFILRRLQYPIVPAFAITINKSLGQTVKIAGVYLPTPVFTHGQFYVASSRTGNADNLRYWIPDDPQYRHPDGRRAFITQNIVWPEILEAAISDAVQLPTSTNHSQPAATTTSTTLMEEEVLYEHEDTDIEFDHFMFQAVDLHSAASPHKGLHNWNNVCYMNAVLQCLHSLCLVCDVQIRSSAISSVPNIAVHFCELMQALTDNNQVRDNFLNFDCKTRTCSLFECCARSDTTASETLLTRIVLHHQCRIPNLQLCRHGS